MYRSYSVSNMPQPVPYEPRREEKPPKPVRPEHPARPENKPVKKEKEGGIFDNLQTDDIILGIVVLALLMDDCDDKLLIAALAFIFLSDFL